MKAKKIIGRLLLALVLISVGFACGREVESRRASATEAAPTAVAGDRVIVYYMHGTFRCVTCNTIESLAKELVSTEFADAIKHGKMEWKTVNYQKNSQLADRYNVNGNTIVLVRFSDGKEVEHKSLNRVMELSHNRDEFMAYVRNGIQDILRSKS